jgi:hypothetical protein
MQPPTRVHAIRLGLLLAATVGLVAHALVFDFINDDAFISFRYADNLVRHGELVFNPGERVEGFTNFLWTLLMAGVIALGGDPVPWSKALGILFAAATLWVVARFTARQMGGPTGWDALAPALLAAAPAYACWSTGGLETQMFTCFATAGWCSYLDERARPDDDRRMPWSGVWFALSAMTRPEGMLFFGLTGLHRLSSLIFVERRLPLRRDWLWGFSFAGVFVPYYAWRWTYYGWPFPNTYYVKTGAKGFWNRGLRYWWSWLRDHGWLWLVLLGGIFRPVRPARRTGRLLTLVGLYTVAVSLHVIRVGGDFMALHRFLVPIMPALAVVAALGVRTAAERLAARGWGMPALGGVAAAACLALGFQIVHVDRAALTVGSSGGVDSIGWLDAFADELTHIGKHLGESMPEDASIATSAAGVIPYYSRLYTLDLLGLNDEWVAHNAKPRGNRPGHTKVAPLDYVLKKDIDLLLYHLTDPLYPERRAQPMQRSARERRGWRGRGYEWRSVEVPGLEPPHWGYWQRIRQP